MLLYRAHHPAPAKCRKRGVANGANIIIKTSDYGKRWRYSNTGYTGGVLGWGTSVSFTPDGKMMFCLIDFGCWLTEDGGGTFRNLEVKRIWGQETSTPGAMHNDTIVVAVGTWEQQVIEVSHDGGKSWTAPYGTSPFNAGSTYGIAVAPNNPDQIYAATASGVWIYNNGRWVQRGSAHGLERDSFRMNFVKAVVVDPIRPNIVYAGKWAPGIGESNGVFRSQDGGLTWENITGHLGPAIEINSINVSPKDSSVFIGTYRGTFRFRPAFARVAISN